MSKRIAFALAATGALILSFFVIAPAASGVSPLICDTEISGGTYTAVTVPAGDNCKLSNATVTGGVIVNKNAEFDSCDNAISGSVTATKSYVNIDNDTTIGGSLTLTTPGLAEVFGGSPCSEKGLYDYSSYVCPSYVGGSVNVLKAPNRSSLEVSIGECGDMQIDGSVNVQHNREFVAVDNSTIVGSLICVDNNPFAQAANVTVGGAQIGCPEL